MSDVVLNILNKRFEELINSGYVAKRPYEWEATRIFGYVADDRTEIKDGQKYFTNIIGRNNNLAFHQKEGSTDYKQNTLQTVEEFAQRYARYAEMCQWTDADDEEISVAMSRATPLTSYGEDALLENARLHTPRQMIDDLYRTFDLTYWFGSENVAKIQAQYANNQMADITTIPTLQTANANNVITTNGVLTHNKIERIAAAQYYTPANSNDVVNQLVDIDVKMKTECGFGINRIVLPAGIAEYSAKAPGNYSEVSLKENIKQVFDNMGEPVEIISSNTLGRFGIKSAIVFHYAEDDYEKVCHCRLNKFNTRDDYRFDIHKRLITAPCGGFEVRIPEGIKIITGIKA